MFAVLHAIGIYANGFVLRIVSIFLRNIIVYLIEKGIGIWIDSKAISTNWLVLKFNFSHSMHVMVDSKVQQINHKQSGIAEIIYLD